MIRVQSAAVACLFGLAAVPALGQQTGASQSTFHAVNNPGGGQYIYGALPGKGTMPDAVVYMLQQVHNYFGDRPEVGKFFGAHDGSSVATFFTVNATKAGNRPMTGLLIVSRKGDGSASGAVVFDDSSRFASTEPSMMKALSAVWQPARQSAAGVPATTHAEGQRLQSRRGEIPPLVQASGGDHSAVISLPEGWKVTFVGGGALTAAGSNGEMVYLGLLYQGYAMGPDLFTNFVNISNENRRKKGLNAGTYSVLSQTKVPGQQPSVQVAYKTDFNDGFGPRTGNVRLVSWGPQALLLYGSNMPDRVASEENATMQAVMNSYHTNDQVVAQEQQGALNRVHADAARAQAQSAAIDARREASTAAYDQQMRDTDARNSAIDSQADNIDRASKMNQDYILDRSVVRDNENGDRGTVSNSYADALVRGNPDRYQIVPTQEMIKGRDF
jgi:hypothetical protein